MRKFGIFTQTIFFSVLIAGFFGILHDQLTFTLSPEYFTRFKFIQFGISPSHFGGNRQTVGMIGFFSTWWVGLFIGISLGLCGLLFYEHKEMKKNIIKSLKLNLIITIAFSVAGFLYGKYHLTKTGVNWWIPGTVIEKEDFITVGSIHNFSYIGGAAGLLAAIIFMSIKGSKQKTILKN